MKILYLVGDIVSDNINSVVNWFSRDENLSEMREGNLNPLKMWEKDVAKEYFPLNACVLDVGCGMGRETFNLYNMGFKITGVDISEKAIESARKFASESNRDIDFIITNGVNLPFQDNSFDVIIIWSQTLGIMYGEERQVSFLKECFRVLKENGILSFSGHDREYLQISYPQYLEDKKFFPYVDHRIYWEMFTTIEMEELAKEAGFEILNCQKGKIYREEQGTILHCECKKRKKVSSQ